MIMQRTCELWPAHGTEGLRATSGAHFLGWLSGLEFLTDREIVVLGPLLPRAPRGAGRGVPCAIVLLGMACRCRVAGV